MSSESNGVVVANGVHRRSRRQQRYVLEKDASDFTMSQNLRALPLAQIGVAVALIVPCLAVIFANTFVLFIPWGPVPTSNSTAAAAKTTTLLPDVAATIKAATTTTTVSTTTVSVAPNATNDAKPAKKPKIIVMKKTVFTDFPLASKKDKKDKSQQIRVLFLLFNGIGSIVAGLLSDTFGRRLICIVFLTWTIAFGLLSTVSSSLIMFEVLWCMVAFGLLGAHVTNLVRIVEMLPNRLRTAAFLMTNGTEWTLARVLAIFFAFTFKDWTLITFFLFFCVCMALLLAHLKPGSIREGPRPGVESKDKLYHVFTHRHLWPRTAACAFCFFVAGLIFYGFNLSRKVFLTNSIFANMAITGLVDFLSQVLAAGTCHGTRRTLPVFMVFMFFNGLCCLVMAPFEACSVGQWESCSAPHKNIVFLTHFSSLFTGGASLNILWLSTASAFPKSVRNFGVGVCSSAGRLGGILGILLVDGGHIYGSVAALVVYGLLAWTAGLTLLFVLPERAFRPLFDSADQPEDFDLRGDGDGAQDEVDVDVEANNDGSVSTVSYSRSESAES